MHFYQAARAPDKATCENHLNKIKDLNSAAYDKLVAAPRDKWAMYATRGNAVWDQVNSNMAESLNSAMGSEVNIRMRVRLFLSDVFRVVAAQGASAPFSTSFLILNLKSRSRVCRR